MILQSRYELRDTLSQGGMGVVYKAYDLLMKREVAVKTLLGVGGRAAAEMFHKEWAMQASLIHPNVVEIYDIGDYDDDGALKPYFVMPLLRGFTLAQIIKSASHRLTVERSVDIICQTCRGLQAAHERGMVHRDLKPSNIFVLDDDSVKIIDFGIVHNDADGHLTETMKGTLPYMAPELLQMKQPSVLSDIFALGAVAYETLTLRRAFEGSNDGEISKAILSQNPPPASEIKKGVNQAIGRVVHKALSKQPERRFASAREFGDTLRKALRNEPIELFDTSKAQTRIERAGRAFERGDHQMAGEILNDLESEGHTDPEIADLRAKIELASRQSGIRTLLKSAQQFFDEEEYPLALRKIQDALALDPADAAALAMQEQVETRRRQQKIDEGTALARRHLQSNSFDSARNTIKSVLELKPNDPAALEILAEVDRRSGVYEQARQQKSGSYDEAVQAWKRGDVAAAWSSLERWAAFERGAPDTDGARLAACQNFYNQVRSENEALNSAYEEARGKLAAQDFAAAVALCDRSLAKYPAHPQFQALKVEAEERQRQDLTALVAETDRQVEAEPDPARRCEMLEAALNKYPGEPRFERALRLARDKRDLVNSVVAKARQLEDQGRIDDAVDQWGILRAIHGQYPGLDREIERLKGRRDSKSGAKPTWVKQVDRYLEAKDYPHALDAAQKGLAEFPGDPELTELEKLARRRVEATAEAMNLLAAGQEAFAQGRQDEGLAAMRRAHAADDGNASIRAILADALAVRARALLETDWGAADRLVGEILDLDPNHALGKNLRSIVADRKREEFVSWCAGQARRLQAAGDADGARAVVQQGLASYPQEPRLTQLMAALDTKPAPTAPPVPPPPLNADLPTVTDRPAPRPLLPTEPVIPARRSEPKTEPKPEPKVAPKSEPKPEPKSEPKSKPVQPAGQNGRMWGMIALAAVVVLIAAAGLYRFLQARKTPPVVAIHVEFRTTPTGAVIKVDGAAKGSSDMALDLPAGTHSVTAELEGYQPAATSIEVKAGAPAAVNLALTPLRGMLRVYSDTPGGEVLLDEQKLNPVQEGAFGADSLTPGTHSVKFSSKEGLVALSLALDTAKMPALTAPVAAKGLQLALVDQSGSHAQFSCNCLPAKVSLDNQPAQDLTPNGLEFSNLTPGSHEFVLNDGKGDRRLAIQAGPASSVTAFIFSKPAPDAGILVVSTGEDKVNVFLNNKPYRAVTQAGQLRIPNLPVGQYKVRVAKDGFDPLPEQTVAVAKGAEAKVEFHLKAISHAATLQVQGAPAGAKILVDGNAVGSVQPDGGFGSQLAPGVHAIELQKDVAKSKPVSKRFAEGLTTLIAGADFVFEKQPGTLRFKVTPPNSHITVRLQSEQETQARVVSTESMPLPEGSYVVTASAPEYSNGTVTVALSAGGSATAEIALKHVPVAPPPPQTLSMANFEAPGEWTRDGVWFVHKGGNFVPFKASPVDGTFAFTIGLLKGRRLQWVVNHTGDKDYVLYRLDKKYLYRDQVVNGKTTELAKVEHHLDKEAWYTVKIEISADKIATSFRRGENWSVADSWSQPGKGFDKGKFGFLIPGKDEFAVNAFSFYPAK